jgi:signal transduction histidine kinase
MPLNPKAAQKSHPAPAPSRQLPWLAAGVILLILVILGTAVTVVTLHLRKVLRAQLVQQDALLLYAASLSPDSALEDLDPELAHDPTVRFAVISDKLLEAAKRRSVVGVRFFDELGQLQISIPLGRGGTLNTNELEKMRRLKPTSSYDSHADLAELGSKGHAPLIRALLPLQQDEQFAGAAEFLLDGSAVAAALKKLDHDLGRYALLIFVMGGGIISGSLAWTFRRLHQANKTLYERSQSLLRANHELTLSAKTAAVGAITAHLIHDLKSPLFGLQSFMNSRGTGDDEDWKVAINSAERMQKMIAEVVRILQEDKITEGYELSGAELVSVLRGKIASQASGSEVKFETPPRLDGTFTNRDANIILLVITNLVQNALQAAGRGGGVSVRAPRETGCIVFEVSDSGPGLPPHVLKNLFTPCRSTKEGGTGLGLAISKQLAAQIGAELALKETSDKGTVFELRIPERVPFADAALR